jgi:hypothetical protein
MKSIQIMDKFFQLISSHISSFRLTSIELNIDKWFTNKCTQQLKCTFRHLVCYLSEND